MLSKRKEADMFDATIWAVPPCDAAGHVFTTRPNERPEIGKVCECGKTRLFACAELIKQ